MALGLPTGYHALPIDFPTVVGDPIQVSLIEPPQASPQFDNGYVVEKKRLVAVIPWPDIAEHRVFSIEIGANGRAVVSDTTESAYENAIDDIASP